MNKYKKYCKNLFTISKKSSIVSKVLNLKTLYERNDETMIKVGIIGATGYAGNELVRLLLGHSEAQIEWFGSRSYIDQKYADIYRNVFQLVDAKCMDDNMEELADRVDVIFTATPQGLCASLVNDKILSKVKIVDLSADFRLKNVDVYEQWYKIEHKSPQYIDEAVYGLCEINRNKITKDTRIVANPGCYTTCSILTIYPLVKEGIIDPDSIIIDAKSGTSGAGRGAKVANLFCKAYEKASLLTAAEEDVRCWTEGTRMTPEELQDTVKESREIAQVFMSIADIIEQTILPSDWRNTDPTDDTPGEVVA